MPVKRRKAKQRRAEIHPDMMALLSDRELNNAFKYFVSDDERRAAWNEAREEILAEWITDAPGTRPSHWWRYDAPRLPLGTFPGCRHDGKVPEPRRRLGGVGTSQNKVLNHVPTYSFGIPTCWVDQWQVDYYNGRAKDIHGEPIGTEYEEGHFAGVAIDPEDPPRYESQATYLRRLGLLLPGELKRLTPADFEPELVMPEDDEDEADDVNDAA